MKALKNKKNYSINFLLKVNLNRLGKNCPVYLYNGAQRTKNIEFMCVLEICNVSCSDKADFRINNFGVYLQNSRDTSLPNPDRPLSIKAVIDLLKKMF